MSMGATLLQLQETDLGLERDRASLTSMPELADLAKKRQAYTKLKAEATKLFARRKDCETDLADLDAREKACKQEVTATQADAYDATDFRAVQDVQNRMSDLAKELEKIEFTRADVLNELKKAKEQEETFAAYIKRFEESVVADTRTARTKAADIQHAIQSGERRRERLLGQLDDATRSLYLQASKRFGSLAVEQLHGDVPSICHTALQPAAMADLSRGGEIATCPNCHRILIIGREDA